MKAGGKRISNIERENTEIRVPLTLHQSLMRNDTVSVLKKERSPALVTLMHNDIIWLSREDAFFNYFLNRCMMHGADVYVQKHRVRP